MQQKSPNWVQTLVVLSVGWFMIYSARTVLSVTLKDIADYWSLTESFLGILSSGFFMAYTALQIPTGILADRFGSRRVLVLGFALQSIAVLISAFSRTHQQFLVARLVSGAGQATYFACQFAIVSRVVPPERRAFGNSASVAGSALGTGLGMIFGRLLSGTVFGWRLPFFVLGIASVLLAMVIVKVVPLNSALKEQSADASKAAPKSPDFTEGKESKADLATLSLFSVTHFLSMYGFFLMLTWLPYYLEAVRGFSPNLAALLPVVMPVTMAVSTILGGIVSDKIGNKAFVVNICLPVSALATIAIPLVGSAAQLIFVLAVYGATGKLVIDPGLISYITENAPSRSRGTILAIFNFAGALAMAAAPVITGFIAEATGSFNISFFMAGAFNFVAVWAFALGVKSTTRGAVKKAKAFEQAVH